jgi:AcrR family transcriptional regulator
MSSGPFTVALRKQANLPQSEPRMLTPEVMQELHRVRLIAALAEVTAEKGYAATTIADVVARAQVSRRTFYEHFADKNACLLATYDAAAELLLKVVAEGFDRPGLTWSQRIEAGISAYLSALASAPGLTRLFLIEIYAVGELALRHRRAAHHRFADQIRDLMHVHRDEFPPGWTISAPLANALVGALNELVLLTLEEGGTGDLREIHDTAVQLVHLIIAPPPVIQQADQNPPPRSSTTPPS